MDTKATPAPGPWSIFENAEGWTVADANKNHVAFCDHPLDDNFDEPSPAETNARLIATAPEMRNALHDLMSQIESMQGESSCIDEDIMQGETYRNARAVLEKAAPQIAQEENQQQTQKLSL